jgi:hypothetical protein
MVSSEWFERWVVFGVVAVMCVVVVSIGLSRLKPTASTNPPSGLTFPVGAADGTLRVVETPGACVYIYAARHDGYGGVAVLSKRDLPALTGC